jgi:hypothetical protein
MPRVNLWLSLACIVDLGCGARPGATDSGMTPNDGGACDTSSLQHNAVILPTDLSGFAWYAWASNAGTVTREGDAGVAPDGNHAATLITLTGTMGADDAVVEQQVGGTLDTHTGSVWLKANRDQDVGRALVLYLVDKWRIVALSSSWTRYAISATFNSEGGNKFGLGYASWSGVMQPGETQVLAWGAEVVRGTIPQPLLFPTGAVYWSKPTVTLNASALSVGSGGHSTLSWSSDGCNCVASGDWTGDKAPSGSEDVADITSKRTFTLTCTNPGGSTAAAVAVGPGATFYVSPSGNDSNDGTSPATAWQTVDKVNSMSYGSGYSVLFEGGQTFTGCLSFSGSNVQSSPDAPLTIGAYGTGAFTLNSNCPGQATVTTGARSAAVIVDGVNGFVLQDCVVSAAGTETQYGVWLRNNGPSAVDHIVVQRCDISGFYTSVPNDSSAEILITGYPGPGLSHVSILDNVLHGANGVTSPDDNGVTGWGNGKNITSVVYRGNTIYNIGGHVIPGLGTSGGNGIIANGVDGALIEYNIAHDNGANAATCGGPCGLWAYNANNVVIQYNEIYREQPVATTFPPGACDWAAYDLDGMVTNSVVQYNYSHDNAGPAMLAYTTAGTWGPNTFRFNVSENDNWSNNDGSGALALSGEAISYAYNNTIFRSGTSGGACWSFGYSSTYSGGVLANNLCINGAASMGQTTWLTSDNSSDPSAVTMLNNAYFDPAGSSDSFSWLGGTTYATLAAFQAATGKEASSFVGDPLAVDAGSGGTCMPAPSMPPGPQPCPAGYRLQPGSPLIGAGADLGALGIDAGTQNYFGASLPTSGPLNIGAY